MEGITPMSTPRTFRIDPKLLKEMEMEAKKRGVSPNAFLSQLLEHHIKVVRHAERFGYIVLCQNNFRKILDKFSEEEITDLAKKAGTLGPKDIVLISHRHLDLDGVYFIVKDFLCDFARWASCSSEQRGTVHRVVLHHKLGRKWSIWLRGYIEAVFESILGAKPAVETVTDESLVFEVDEVKLRR